MFYIPHYGLVTQGISAVKFASMLQTVNTSKITVWQYVCALYIVEQLCFFLLCRWLCLLDWLASADSWTCSQVDWQAAFCHSWSASWRNGLDSCQHVCPNRSLFVVHSKSTKATEQLFPVLTVHSAHLYYLISLCHAALCIVPWPGVSSSRSCNVSK